ncbi:MAG: SUF system NifU family Fe-S cluster assembly protein [Thermoflexus sp.]|uniref:Fe-S cluster assembly sulfur transfer protein SufU n=1 Tax=Thermoflexus sp. TaxID=1969742 RepID=UPI003320ABFC
MEDLYREIILDHYENPRNYGVLPDPDISYEDDNPLCGDRIRIDMKIRDGRIVDVRFSGKGCAISQASASMLTERIKGATVEEARSLTREDVLAMLGIPLGPARIKCALLALKVLKAGLYRLPKIDWEELD